MNNRKLSLGKAALVILVSLALGMGVASTFVAGAVDMDASESAVTANTSQRTRLTDGLVTFDEYSSSIDEAIACAQEQGIYITEPTIGLDGVTLNYSIYESELGPQTIEVFDACYNKLAHVIDVEFQTSVEVEAARRSHLGEMAVCIYGSEANAIAAAGDLMTAIHADAQLNPNYDRCRAEATVYTSITATASGLVDLVGAPVRAVVP